MKDRVTIQELIRWEEEASTNQIEEGSSEKKHDALSDQSIKFPIRHDLNKKIILWKGPIWQLEIDAIVNTTNENLSDRSGICQNILDAAGDEIAIECMACENCRTGEAVSTRGCQLYAKRIIHTVGPRYNEKYKNAAENALHSCYRNCLRVAKEDEMTSLAFCCVYTHRKCYPRDKAAHIAIRTVRRFLEHYGDAFNTIVFCVDEKEDYVIYERFLPWYFPRSLAEQTMGQSQLPENIGNEFGEPVIEDRKIRISSFPATFSQSEDDNHVAREVNLFNEPTESNSSGDFCKMVEDPDAARLQNIRRERSRLTLSEQREQDASQRYQRCLRRARGEDLRDIAALNLIYKAGYDHEGNPVMVYVANRLPATVVDLDRVLVYIIQVMNSVVHGNYSVVYVHSNMKGENQPEIAWIKRLFKTFSSKYRANMKVFYVLHPTIWLKMVLWVVKSLVDDSFYRKVNYITNAHDLFNFAPRLELPDHAFRNSKSDASSTSSRIVDSREQL